MTIIGFDLLTPVTSLTQDQNKWNDFLQKISEKYENQDLLTKDETKLVFNIPSSPKIPLDGLKFRRFWSDYNGKGIKGIKVVKGVFKLAQDVFGPERVELWDENKNELGHYSWRDVELAEQENKANQVNVKVNQVDEVKVKVEVVTEDKKKSKRRLVKKTSGVDLKPGEVILDYGSPFVKILLHMEKGHRCNNCFKKKDANLLFRCSGCQEVLYCSKKCQKIDWKCGHSIECKSLFFRHPIESCFGKLTNVDMSYKVIRLMSLLKLKPSLASEEHEMYDGSFRCFNDLVANEQLVKEDPDLTKLCYLIHLQFCQDGKLFNEGDTKLDHIIWLYGIWRTNSFEILNETSTQPIGFGIYVPHAFIEHSCRPNALIVTSLCHSQVRCIALIPKGTKPTVSYLAGDRDIEERKRVLKSRYNIECKCEMCVEEETSPLIDYEHFYSLYHIIRANKLANWTAVSQARGEIMSMYKKLYHEYDERVTKFCFECWEILLQNQEYVGRMPTPLLTRIVRDVDRRLWVTYGTGHNKYKAFVEENERLGILC